MNRSILLVLFPALLGALVVGCGERKTVTSRDGTKDLSLTQPLDQTLKQGETNKVNVMIGRTGFAGDVDIDFHDLPKGVKVAEDTNIPAGDSMRAFTLVAEDDAPPVEKKAIRVEAKAQGMRVDRTFSLTVKPKG